MFKKNIGPMDRAIRFSIAIALLLFAVWKSSWLALLFSIFTFYEALAGWCVIYQILGKNSCPLDNEKK